MVDLERTVQDLMARVEALERENRVLLDNQEASRMSAPPPDERGTSAPEPISRRWVLRRAAETAAATVVAGVIISRQNNDAIAHHAPNVIQAFGIDVHSINVVANEGVDAGAIYAHSTSENFFSPTIQAVKNSAGTALLAESTGGMAIEGVGGGEGTPAILGRNPDGAGVKGVGGFGVWGVGNHGVVGETSATGYTAIWGKHNATGIGVTGDGGDGSEAVGVLGRASLGTGTRGEGSIGLHGVSPDGDGVYGDGGTGYGGVFRGRRSQLRLIPANRIGKPNSGYHKVGELFLDKLGTLYICAVAGTPGTWKQVSTTAT
jgi:hypothetical protein